MTHCHRYVRTAIVQTTSATTNHRRYAWTATASSDDEHDNVPPPLCVDSESSDDEQASTPSSVHSDESNLRFFKARRLSPEEREEFYRKIEAKRGTKYDHSADTKPLDPNRPL